MPITAWMLPDSRSWYDIRDLPVKEIVDGEQLLELTCEGGYLISGRLRRHERSGALIWYQVGASGQETALVPWRDPRLGMSEHVMRGAPTHWRPLNADTEPMAPPVVGPIRREMPLDPELPECFEEVDGWPYPELRLGERTRPRSQDEAEARVLRALRTMRRQRQVGPIERKQSADWPSEWVRMMTYLNDKENNILGDDQVPWFATRRDLGDWVYALSWYAPIAAERRSIIALRSARPVWSWRQIADVQGCSPATAARRYDRGVDELWVNARKPPLAVLVD